MSLRRALVCVGLFWSSIALAAWLGSRRPFESSDVWAVALNALAFAVFASLPPVRALLGRLPRPHVAALVLLFLGPALGAALVGVPREANFPFIKWDMFSDPRFDADPTFLEYVGRGAEGARVPLNPSRLVPSLRHGRIALGLQTRYRRRSREEFTRLRSGVEALGRAYNRHHPEAPIYAVEVWVAQVSMQSYPETSRRRVAVVNVFPREDGS